MIVEKEIIRPGTYWYSDPETGLPRKYVATPQDVKHFHDAGNEMLAAGLSIPVPLEHQPGAKPLTPAEKAAQQLKNNAGWNQKYLLKKIPGDDGKEVEALFGGVEIVDKEVAGKLGGAIRWTSPTISSFTDGNGKEWKNVITHLALTTRPRITKQQPFPSVQAAMSFADVLVDTPIFAKGRSPGDVSLSRAGLLKKGESGSYKPAFPVAFSLYSGIALAEEMVKEKAKDKGPPEKEGDGKDKKEGLPEKKMPPKEGMEDEEGMEEMEGMESLIDSDGDIPVIEVIADLLEAEGYALPEGTTAENFAERMYNCLMEKLKSKGNPEGNMPDHLATPPNPAANNPGQPKPPVVPEAPPLYMSLEEVNAITDPQQKRIATMAFSLQQNAFNEAKRRRQERLERLSKRIPKAALDKLVAQAATASLSLSADGVVKDSLADTLEILEAGLELPEILTTPSTQLSVQPHPKDLDEKGEWTQEKHDRTMGELKKNTYLPDLPKAS
jgi:hypothetical protein